MSDVTNYPYGVSSFGIPLVGSGPVLTTGKVLFVSSTTGASGIGRGYDPTKPLATITQALSNATAAKGDVILLMPGHAENITSAGALTISKSGVTIVGLGNGRARAALTFTTATTATIVISAANVRISNVVFFYTGFDAIGTGISVTGSSLTLDNCSFVLGDVTNQAAAGIILGTGADRFKIENCLVSSPAAGPAVFIGSGVALDQVIIRNNYIYGNFSTSPVSNTVAAWTNCFIDNNLVSIATSGIPAFSLHASATGMITNNRIACNTISAGGSITAAACFKLQNYATDTAAGSGVLDPTVVTL